MAIPEKPRLTSAEVLESPRAYSTLVAEEQKQSEPRYGRGERKDTLGYRTCIGLPAAKGEEVGKWLSNSEQACGTEQGGVQIASVPSLSSATECHSLRAALAEIGVNFVVMIGTARSCAAT